MWIKKYKTFPQKTTYIALISLLVVASILILRPTSGVFAAGAGPNVACTQSNLTPSGYDETCDGVTYHCVANVDSGVTTCTAPGYPTWTITCGSSGGNYSCTKNYGSSSSGTGSTAPSTNSGSSPSTSSGSSPSSSSNTTTPGSATTPSTGTKGLITAKAAFTQLGLIFGGLLLLLVLIGFIIWIVIRRRKFSQADSSLSAPVGTYQQPQAFQAQPIPQQPTAVSPVQPISAIQHCTNCGQPLTPGSKFCGACGNPVVVA